MAQFEMRASGGLTLPNQSHRPEPAPASSPGDSQERACRRTLGFWFCPEQLSAQQQLAGGGRRAQDGTPACGRPWSSGGDELTQARWRAPESRRAPEREAVSKGVGKQRVGGTRWSGRSVQTPQKRQCGRHQSLSLPGHILRLMPPAVLDRQSSWRRLDGEVQYIILVRCGCATGACS
jgi:hypothetical protein